MSADRDIDQFVKEALEFKSTLASAKDFDEIRDLWAMTRIEYKYNSVDPYSDEYKAEVLGLYSRLTSESYTPLNELTSTKQTATQFEVGFPWITQNLDVISQELAKVVQAMRGLHARCPKGAKLIEFGAGWGNLAIPLARSGQRMTVVDIDRGFLERIAKLAAKDNLEIKCLLGDFLKVARITNEKFDAVIFQSSFHHCLDFSDILDAIREHMLTEHGCIFFFSEPVHRNFPFPWGLRYDGESLWAIMCNKWLELGFDESFFFNLLLSKGFFLSRIESIGNVVGDGWVADRGLAGIAFEDWALPEDFDRSYHPRDGARGLGRFCRDESFLPGLENGLYTSYDIVFQNFANKELGMLFKLAEQESYITIEAGAEHQIRLSGKASAIIIRSETYVPDEMYSNGDLRQVGVALKRISLA